MQVIKEYLHSKIKKIKKKIQEFELMVGFFSPYTM